VARWHGEIRKASCIQAWLAAIGVRPAHSIRRPRQRFLGMRCIMLHFIYQMSIAKAQYISKDPGSRTFTTAKRIVRFLARMPVHVHALRIRQAVLTRIAPAVQAIGGLIRVLMM